MSFINIEIKATTNRADEIRSYLQQQHADFKGVDHQKDTYFNVPKGRLKLRQGNIENTLIYYERENTPGLKHSDFNLVQVADGAAMLELLTKSLGVKVVVDKHREIYFIDNVKFHIDKVPALGSFVEIEASDKYKPLSVAALTEQCRHYMDQFKILDSDIINLSYSDMLLQKN